jgi:TRAP-type C4-dicarboxylate transport system substrate-binding protein
MDWLERESGGRLRVQPYWSASLLSSENAMTELRHGVADVGLITPIYVRGGAHLIRAQAGFYGGAVTFAQQVGLYRCLVAEEPQFDRELAGLRILAVQGGNLPVIITRNRAVHTLADLKGMRLRAPSELLEVLEDFGADPVDMPMRDVYPALAKGVLDGVVAPLDTFKSLHFAEVTSYVNTIVIPRGAYAARAMNERRWRELTPAEQALLEAATPVWEQALERELTKANDEGTRAAREGGVAFSDMPATDQAQFDEVYARDGEHRAHNLVRFGIDGMRTFHLARRIAAAMTPTNGVPPCKE